MPTATFRGAYLKGFKVLPNEGGRICRANFEADYTEKLIVDMDAFDWRALPEGSTFMKLKGQLIGGETMTLTPNGSLKNQEITIACCSAQKFQVVQVTVPKREATNDVVRFEVLFNSKDCVAVLDAFMATCGTASGIMKIKYTAQEVIDNDIEDGDEDEVNQRSLVDIEEPKANGKSRARAEIH